MAQTQVLIQILKQALRKARITYADIAHHMDMSEANVKRLFASQGFTMQRLETICGMMQMELSETFNLKTLILAFA